MIIKMKNKILLDNITLNDEELFLENEYIKEISASGTCVINLFKCNIMDLKINVTDNSSLTINYFNIIDEKDTNITITVNDKSSCTLNHSFINNHKYNLNIYTDFLKEEGTIKVNIHGINDSGKLTTNVNGYVKTEKINNYLDENIRIINLNNGEVTSNPNMYIDTSKVIANHNTTIGNIRLDELFYLMSKGLDKEESTRLITKGFLIKIISNNEIKTKISEILN